MVYIYQSKARLWSVMVFRVSIRPELVGFNFDVYPCIYMSDVFVGDLYFATWRYIVYLGDDCFNECRCVVSEGGAGIVSIHRLNGWRRCSSLESLDESPIDRWEHCSSALSVGICISK